MVLTRSKPFWGQFWGQNGKTDSDSHQSYKYATLVPLRNADTNITRFSHRKSSMNQYINFALYTEVVHKHYSTPSPYTAPVTVRNAPVWAHSRCIGVVLVQPNTTLNSPLSGDFLFCHNGIYLNWIFLYR